MYQRFALPKPGFQQTDVVSAASEVAGTDMSEFFTHYLFGKDPLPYERDFAYAGIEAHKASDPHPWTGATLSTNREGRVIIGNIIPGSPAENAGLDRGDIIVAVDERSLDQQGIEKNLAARSVGDHPVFTVIRHGELRKFPVTLAANPYPAYTLKSASNPGPLEAQTNRSVLNIH